MRDCLYVLFAYLSGCLLYARFFSHLMKKDAVLTASKDQNPGASNAFQYGGFWCGFLTLSGDILKGFIPVYLYLNFDGAQPVTVIGTVLVLAAPVIGHIWPAPFGFRGGKGIATSFGCLLGLMPDVLPLCILTLVFIFFSVVLRISPNFHRTIVTYLCASILMLVVGVKAAVCAGFLLISGCVCLRLHTSTEDRENIKVNLLWIH